MRTKTFAIAASLVLSLSGVAFAQTAAGGGSAEGNMNNPGSVKSNSEKGMERSTGSATGGAMGADRMATPGASGGPATDTVGSPAGSGSGNGTTGSGAAPSGK